jgi:hypothetical protein
MYSFQKPMSPPSSKQQPLAMAQHPSTLAGKAPRRGPCIHRIPGYVLGYDRTSGRGQELRAVASWCFHNFIDLELHFELEFLKAIPVPVNRNRNSDYRPDYPGGWKWFVRRVCSFLDAKWKETLENQESTISNDSCTLIASQQKVAFVKPMSSLCLNHNEKRKRLEKDMKNAEYKLGQTVDKVLYTLELKANDKYFLKNI